MIHAAASSIEVFWGEVSPCEHMVQIYADEGAFIDTLTRFIGDGLRRGEVAVVIATAAHQTSLALHLREAGIDLDAARAGGSFVALDAATTLSRFMVNGWPDAGLFHGVVDEIIGDARREGRKVRAFGEMVALLWAQGHQGATVQLEHLWNEVCGSEGLALFCAYPRIGATRDLGDSLAEVCALHSRVLAA